MKLLSRQFVLPVMLAATCFASLPADAADTGKVNWQTTPKLSLNGLGQVKIGMTLKELKALFSKVEEQDAGAGTECFYAVPKGVPKGISFMITGGKVARIDVDSANYSSMSGAKVGQTEKQVSKLYNGKLEVAPHHYDEKGHYLTFVPKDSKDKNFRMVFETDGKTVTTFRAGKLPEVEYVEGCS